MAKKENWRNWNVPYREDGSVDWQLPDEYEDNNGRVYFTAYNRNNKGKIIWKPNNPFRASIKFVKTHINYDGLVRYSIFQNTETKATYPMRISDLAFCIKNGVLIGGLILGTWRFRRNARRMSIVPVELLSVPEYNRRK